MAEPIPNIKKEAAVAPYVILIEISSEKHSLFASVNANFCQKNSTKYTTE